jgi:hypothetical protein
MTPAQRRVIIALTFMVEECSKLMLYLLADSQAREPRKRAFPQKGLSIQ